MKYLFFILVSLLACSGGTAQKAANLQVTYINTQLSGGNEIAQEQFLFINGQASYYLIKQRIDNRPAMEETQKEDGSTHYVVRFKDQGDSGIYIDQRNRKMVMKAPFFDEVFRVEDDLPKIDWQLTGKTKKVATYTCHEAVGHFRGRDYSAWFTTEIQVSAGPFKFSGLPGLILEVNDHEKKFNWYCKAIKSLPEAEKALVREPNKGKKISHSDFYDLVINTLKQQFMRMEANGNVTVDKLDISTKDWLERTK